MKQTFGCHRDPSKSTALPSKGEENVTGGFSGPFACDCCAPVVWFDSLGLFEKAENESADGDQSQDDDQQVGHDFELFA